MISDSINERSCYFSTILGLLRYLNQELHTYLPSILCHTDVPLSAPYSASADKYPLGLHTEMRPLYDFTPIMTIVNTPSATRCDSDTSNYYRTINSVRDNDVEHTVKEKKVDKTTNVNDVSKNEMKKEKEKEKDGEGETEMDKEEELEMSHYTGGYTDPPWCNTASPPMITSVCRPLGPSSILLEGPGLIPTSKHRIFADIKADHFSSSLVRSAVRTTRTEDDYDYPDDLPTVSINRFKSFRAKEESEIRGLSGEDFISASILCQVRSELKNVPIERLRRNYSHPMDDGQARTFKVRYTVYNENVTLPVFRILCCTENSSSSSTKLHSFLLPILLYSAPIQHVFAFR